MQSRQKLILGLAALFAVIAGVLFYHFLNDLNKPTAQMAQKTIFVAARDLQARGPISPSMLESVSRPANAVDSDAITNLDQVKGKIALTTIPTGGTITLSRIGSPDNAPLTARMRPGMRAVTIPIDSVRGVANLIQPGDRVDIMSIQRGSGSDQSQANTKISTIMRGVVVLAMGKTIEHSTPTKDDQNNPPPDATTVTLGMDAKRAEELALADSTSSLRLTLRPAKETTRDLPVAPYVLETSAPLPRPQIIQAAPVAAAPRPVAAPPAPHKGLAITVIDGDHIVGDHQ